MASPVQVGDVVRIVKHEQDYVGAYGQKALEPFTVDSVRRPFGERRIACAGGGHAGVPGVRQARAAGEA